MLILSKIKSALSIDEANRKLHRENYFSEEFLMDALRGVGFQSVEVLTPTEEGGVISLNAELRGEKGNSFKIKIRHMGNVLSLSARPANINGMHIHRNVNHISMTNIYSRKYIKSEKEDGLVFGNQSQVNLLRECKSKANLFFEELKDEFERRRRIFPV